jgi:hypothetical protein
MGIASVAKIYPSPILLRETGVTNRYESKHGADKAQQAGSSAIRQLLNRKERKDHKAGKLRQWRFSPGR